MSAPTGRDLELGRATWARRAEHQERSAGRAEQLHGDGTDPAGAAQVAGGDWYRAAAMRQTIGDHAAAATAWRRAAGWARRSYEEYRAAGTDEPDADVAERPLTLAVVAGDRSSVAAIVAPADLRSDGGRPWARVLLGLAAGDDQVTRSAAQAHDRAVEAATTVAHPDLPGLGGAAVAVLDGDTAAFEAQLGRALPERERTIRRGVLRNKPSALLWSEGLVLWRAAADRGLAPAVDDRYRAVPVRFTVPRQTAADPYPPPRFLWPVDLVPTDFLSALSD